MQCNRIDRGQDLSPVQSCDGPGDIAVFYTNAVWFCAGLTLAFLFLQGGSTGYGSVGFGLEIQLILMEGSKILARYMAEQVVVVDSWWDVQPSCFW